MSAVPLQQISKTIMDEAKAKKIERACNVARVIIVALVVLILLAVGIMQN